MLIDCLRRYVDKPLRRVYQRGDSIYHEGDYPDQLYILEKGLVGLFHSTEKGHEALLRIFSSGQLFGHRAHLAQEPYHGSTVALLESTISIISKQQFNKACTLQPQLLHEVAKIMAKELSQAELRLAGLVDKPAFIRIAEALVFLKLRYPDYTWTRKEIAEYSGSTFETVARAMTHFAGEGLIIKQGRDFVLQDSELLLAYVNEVY